jgi:lipopolysaccharide transport system ATP-binding protein
MSNDVAINVHGLGKRFELGAAQGSYQLLTETVSDRVRSFGRRAKSHEFWALRDIDFEVKRGETFGVIGHNGAGKSTLLKILSRITPPTEGYARLRGRVGALLEVGTGFHPELTGRENVFLNGAILSMTRREIERKFWDIIEFADIGPFIDTPVKRYSSGMQLRLAFSVAAYLEPEILIVDEVLSVGDIAFQEKCLGRMEAASREGRTVLFISHNLGAVRALCDRAMMLSEGRVAAIGGVSEVVDTYVGDLVTTYALDVREREDRSGNGRLRFTDIHFEREGRPIDSPTSGEDCEIVLNYETVDGRRLGNASFGITIAPLGDALSAPLLNLDTETSAGSFQDVPAHGEVRCHLPRCPLPGGQYFLNLWAEVDHEQADAVLHACELTVAGGDFFGTGREPPAESRTVLVDHSWSLAPTEELIRPQPAGTDGDPATAGSRSVR